MAPAPRAAPPRALAVALGAALTCAAVTVVLGLAGSPAALPTGTLLAGVLALSGGCVLLRSGPPGGRPPGFRTAGACAALLYGTGQLLLGAQQITTGGPLPFPAPGDLVALSAAPVALVTVVLLPRPAGPTGRFARLLPDAVVVGSAVGLLLWRLAFVDQSAGAAESVVSTLIIVVELSVVALMLQVAVIGLDRGVQLLTTGTALLAAGDALTADAALEGASTVLWPSTVLLCLGWPLICAGLLLVRPATDAVTGAGQAGAEARASATTVVILAASAATAGVLSAGAELDLASIVLLSLLLGSLALRELLLQQQRVRQLGDLSRLAHQDPLTGLGNRRALVAAMDAAVGSEGPTSVMVLDLDGFKEVNDRLGHSTGDALLVAVAGALVDEAPRGVGAFRLGGDEFALLGPLGEERMTALAGAVAAAVHRAAGGVRGVHRVRLSASFGVVGIDRTALDPTLPGTDAMAAVSAASTAMQAAKRAGRDRVVLYTGDVAAAARRRGLVERRLREAVEQGLLRVHLQPVVDVATGALRGFEALSRWSDAELGDVEPAEFVPVAEGSGLVVPLGRAALRQGLAALVACGGVERRLSLAVNASPVELRSEGYLRSVREALEEHGVPADLLVVEVTEAVLVAAGDTGDAGDAGDAAVATLAQLGELGVTVAVDDFGTGCSSLAHLTRLPVHVLKVDRSLTAGLGDPATRAVVEAMVTMGRALGLDVVAEGVEDDAQARTLLEVGVRSGQGWLWSPAVPPSEAAAMVASGEPLSAPAPARLPAPR